MQSLPLVQRAAPKAADSTAFDHLRLEASSHLSTAGRWASEQSYGLVGPAVAALDPLRDAAQSRRFPRL